MKNDKLEYVRVACFVVIAVSLSVIAWNMVTQVSELHDIADQLTHIVFKLQQLNN